jgi:hypothetical protein
LLPCSQISPTLPSGSSAALCGSTMMHHWLRAIWPQATWGTAPGSSAATSTARSSVSSVRSKCTTVGGTSGATVETNSVASAIP